MVDTAIDRGQSAGIAACSGGRGPDACDSALTVLPRGDARPAGMPSAMPRRVITRIGSEETPRHFRCNPERDAAQTEWRK